MDDRRSLDIVLINPSFRISFWGLEGALPLIGKRAGVPNAALPLLAALTPAHHRVTLMDEAVERIDFARCRRADIVGVTGMMVQRQRMQKILGNLCRDGVRHIVVGGPWITVQEDDFKGLVDTIFVGEAEETWPQFLEDFERGEPQRRYEQTGKTDMATVPAPRLDLLKMSRYAFGSLQISRGCPFTCEFCDIIVVFGRRPRLKTPEQVAVELDQLKAHGMREVFIVDDNLIGDRKAIRPMLERITAWQQAHNYPINFMTEASLDLADDAALMELMTQAGVSIVFVGIESTNEASLVETRKLQNLRKSGTILEKVRRIQDTGLEVWSGMIVGFDNDDVGVFRVQSDFLRMARIPIAMMGMLVAIPRTPLYARLAAAGRLDERSESAYETNVLPLRMDRADLKSGYGQTMQRIYAAKAYLDRLDALYLDRRFILHRGWRAHAANRPLLRLGRDIRDWVEAAAMALALARAVRDRRMRALYLRRIWRFVRLRPDAPMVRFYVFRCLVHHHFRRLATPSGLGVINAY